jgi:hypothetical protein
MGNPYDVSHIYDETGSAKARHHEFLRAAETRHLAGRLKRGGDGLQGRDLPSVGENSIARRIRSWSTRSTKVVETYWWVPAGIAVLFLLRFIVGG